MGSGSSHLRSHPPKAKVKRTTKRSFSALICGASSSRVSETEDYPAESLVNSAEYSDQVLGKVQGPAKESNLRYCEGTRPTRSEAEPGSSSGSSSEDTCEHALSDINRSGEKKHCSESHELISSHEPKTESKRYLHRVGDTASTACRGQQSSVNVNSSVDALSDVVDNHLPQIQTSPDDTSYSNLVNQERGSVPSDEVIVNGQLDEVRGFSISDSITSPIVSASEVGSQSLEDDTIQEVTPSDLGFLMSDGIQGQAEASILPVDTVSISSGSLSGSNSETSTNEGRRNGRRMFWDAFSTHSSRRHTDFSTVLFATEDTENIGSHRRWLLDFGGDFFDGGDSWHLGRRSHAPSERRWHSRSQLLGRLRGGAGESGRRRTCPLGLHPDGPCLCELDEEAGARASISRIVMLAEALFEVLDEIHRQPTSFSLSMVSHPAAESVVNSLPLRSYKRPDAIESADDVDQCYICLAEYEEGDRIRILPCHHEYHMSCVDKWLKEIHGVCPLCRGNVSEAVRQGTTVDSDAFSLQSDLV